MAGVQGSPTSSTSTSTTSTVVNVGVQVGQALLDLSNKQDPARFATARAWLAAATQGDEVALCKLQYMGGLRGCAPGGCGGAQTCGFATSVAKQYAEQLYQFALKVLAGEITPSTPLPPAPAPSPSVPPFISGPIIAGAGPIKEQIVQGRVADWFAVALPWLVVIGGGALVVVLVMRARNR